MLAGLRMSAAMLALVIDHVAAARPNEGVGLVAAVADGEFHRAVAFFPGTNVDYSPTRYTMDPVEVLSAFRVMSANGWHLAAIVHSHVASPPTPSTTDLREAYYPDALLLIIGFDGDEVAVKLWRPVSIDSSAESIAAQLIVDRDV